MNGDLMVQFSAPSMLVQHKASDAWVTVATREYEHPVPFGVVEAADDGRLESVTEKPVWRGLVNAGIYVVSPAALELVPSDVSSTMPGLVERCLEDNLKVGVWRIESDWIDVGTPKDLARAKGNE